MVADAQSDLVCQMSWCGCAIVGIVEFSGKVVIIVVQPVHTLEGFMYQSSVIPVTVEETR